MEGLSEQVEEEGLVGLEATDMAGPRFRLPRSRTMGGKGGSAPSMSVRGNEIANTGNLRGDTVKAEHDLPPAPAPVQPVPVQPQQ